MRATLYLRPHQVRDLFQVFEILVVEACGLMGVDIQNRPQVSGKVAHWDYDLGSSLCVTCDVSRERVDVGHNLGLQELGGSATDPVAERDFETADRTLIGADSEKTWFNYPIETYPTGVG